MNYLHFAIVNFVTTIAIFIMMIPAGLISAIIPSCPNFVVGLIYLGVFLKRGIK